MFYNFDVKLLYNLFCYFSVLQDLKEAHLYRFCSSPSTESQLYDQ